MTREELTKAVLSLIDENCMEMGKEEYIDFLEEVAGDIEIRAEAVRSELAEDDE